ncbi:MAG: hypothetical protein HQL96_01365 [Magnetococcales bacterium]|nr:hypothetical protein [Magnetococcales bacterium]
MVEAMAAGCLVVTSNLGALPEVGAGHVFFGNVPSDPREHARRFAGRVIHVLQNLAAHPAVFEESLQAQVSAVGSRHTWSNRALAWERWLAGLLMT